MPIRRDTFYAGDFLAENDTTTRPDGLLAVGIEPESVAVQVGEQLRFDNVTFTQFTFDFPATDLSGPAGTPIGFSVSYDALATEDRLLAVDTVDIESGTLTVSTRNRLPVVLTYTLTLNGFTTPAGAPLSRTSVLPPAAGDGTYATNTIVFDLAGVRLRPAAMSAALTTSGMLTGAAINPIAASDAVVQDGSATIVVRALAGRLDPAQTPELTVAVEDAVELASGSVDFGAFESAIAGLTINDAVADLTIRNEAQAPLLLSGFTLGAARLDATGQILRTPAGAPAYETDAAGAPILVTVADPGATTLAIGRGDTTMVSLAGGAFVDRLVHLVLSDTRVAVVAAGTARAGDGQPSRITRSDDVEISFRLTVGLDFTIPDSGVVFRPDSNATADGLELDTDDADDLVTRLTAATGTSLVSNGTPFSVTVETAIIAGRRAFNADVFTLPGSLMLTTVTVPAGTVDATGRVTDPADAEVTLSLTPDQVRLLLGPDFTAGVRIRIKPGSGSGGRGALRSTDRVIVTTRANFGMRSGSP